ncbi:hypothetical protein PoB_005993000 [Plakobranchus ocellatus]|uniref:Uncharacterized protein n=1 Tax=Plakobranchus ocellatus TaxID=259542 RepID=A0AAV4CNI0_9GAST|nr:hypothetical protein PoB_005993000 [Plakobranchus ocellatus]
MYHDVTSQGYNDSISMRLADIFELKAKYRTGALFCTGKGCTPVTSCVRVGDDVCTEQDIMKVFLFTRPRPWLLPTVPIRMSCPAFLEPSIKFRPHFDQEGNRP